MDKISEIKFGKPINSFTDNIHKVKINDQEYVAYEIPMDKRLPQIDYTYLLSFRHENIVRINSFVDHFCIMEFMDCGSLDDYLHGDEQREYTVKDGLKWAYQIAKGMDYMDSKSFSMCRYLSPKRLLLCDNFKCLKINILCDALLRKYCTCEYIAPEVLSQGNITIRSDFYSFGIVLWEIMSRKRPYYHVQYTEEELKSFILKGLRPPLCDIQGKKPIQTLIKWCLDSDPQQRPNNLLEGLVNFIKKYDQMPDHVIQADLGAVIDINDITEEKNIGNGSFGLVYKANWCNQIKAVKKCNSYTECREDRINIKLIRKLINIRHPNVLRILGIALVGDDKHILMDYAECGSLDSYLYHEDQREYTVDEALNWMHQAIKGISVINLKNQWSLKPRNMMLFKNYTQLKICDFYVSDIIYSPKKNNDIIYIAPEVLEGSQVPDDELLSKKQIIYGFGIVFWEVMSRKKPVYHLKDLSEAKAIKQIKKGRRPDTCHIRKSNYNTISSIIKSCWDTDSHMRPHCVDLEAFFSNPSMSDDYFNELSPRMPSITMSDVDQIEKCKTLQLIGHGRYTIVKKGIWRNKEIVLKKWQRNISNENQIDTITDFKFEFAWIGTQSHTNILKVYGSIFDNEHAYFFEDYAGRESLYNYLHGEEQRDYSPELALDWMRQAAEAMQFLLDNQDNNHHFIHGNIRPQNMMLSENFTHLKLCDYFFSENIASILKYEPNRAYIDPDGDSHRDGNYTEKSAVYSFGIVLWEVMSRKKPFYHIADISSDTKIDKVERPPLEDIGKWKYKNLEKLIEYCWDSNPEVRPEIAELRYLLNNPELLDNMFLEVVNVPPIVTFSDIKLEENKIDTGAYGTVYKAKWSEKAIAVKIIKNEDERAIPKEAKHLSRVNHENIVKLYGISYQNKSLYLLMEYADCGSLHKYLHDGQQRKYRTADAMNWMDQCIKGIAYMHGKKPKPIVHRDLKPANLLLFDNSRILKLGDFGTVADLTSIMTTGLGTPSYIAPEVLEGGIYSEKCDIYSFGIILWEVMSRKKPFNRMDKDAIIFKTISGEHPNIEDIRIKDYIFHSFIKRCLSLDPNMRPKAENFWFQDNLLPDIEF